ncbi:hypothetical protein MLPF_0777 [Mycobacterium lepromatosis]|nr:hypothetical protein MLPF_0777 [Mycobacterium lepromatosis]
MVDQSWAHGWVHQNDAIGHYMDKDTVTAWFVFHIDSAIVLHQFDNQFVAYARQGVGTNATVLVTAINGGILGIK